MRHIGRKAQLRQLSVKKLSQEQIDTIRLFFLRYAQIQFVSDWRKLSSEIFQKTEIDIGDEALKRFAFNLNYGHIGKPFNPEKTIGIVLEYLSLPSINALPLDRVIAMADDDLHLAAGLARYLGLVNPDRCISYSGAYAGKQKIPSWITNCRLRRLIGKLFVASINEHLLTGMRGDFGTERVSPRI